MSVLDAVIIGAGLAGLGVSYFLQKDHRPHIVFEKGRIGETWLSQRWDSFRLNTLNTMNVLPGLPYDGPQPDGFGSVDELAVYLQRYVETFHLPVKTDARVISVKKTGDGKQFRVSVSGTQGEETFLSRSVVVAAGIQNKPKYPALHNRLPASIAQYHTATYRNPAALPPGAVVIVGSGQSGCQVAEDLLDAGRTVYLCTSKVGRVPRRYRGKDIVDWWVDMGFWDVTYASLPNKALSRIPQPQVSGVGRRGHTVSLQSLARQGIVILGRLLDLDGDALILGDDGPANVQFGDEFSQKQKDNVDELTP